VNRDELNSQLSAMFDGELPSAECELLSRRLVREEPLRAIWSRYAVIGAALRAEPVARVRPDFARRISARLAAPQAGSLRGARRARLWRASALGGAMAAGVAGAAILLLRSGLPVAAQGPTAYAPAVARAARPATILAPAASVPGSAAAAARELRLAGTGEPASYVVPPRAAANSPAIPASLADYVVAHSAVSSSLVRGSVLSGLIGNESMPATAPLEDSAEGGTYRAVAPAPARAAQPDDARP